MKKRVLVVEDQELVRLTLKKFFNSNGMDVVESVAVDDALQKCAGSKFDLLVLDYHLTGGDVGWDVATEVRVNPAKYHSPKIMAISGTADMSVSEPMGFKREHFDLLVAKPFDLSILKIDVQRLLDA